MLLPRQRSGDPPRGQALSETEATEGHLDSGRTQETQMDVQYRAGSETETMVQTRPGLLVIWMVT